VKEIPQKTRARVEAGLKKVQEQLTNKANDGKCVRQTTCFTADTLVHESTSDPSYARGWGIALLFVAGVGYLVSEMLDGSEPKLTRRRNNRKRECRVLNPV
jgi:hypothetical protein